MNQPRIISMLPRLRSAGSSESTQAARLLSFHCNGHFGRTNSKSWQYGSRPFSFVSSRDWHSYALGGRGDREKHPKEQHRQICLQYPDHSTMQSYNYDNRRSFHSSVPNERAVAIIMGLATISAAAFAGSSAIQSYREWKASQPSEEELQKMKQQEEEEQQKQQQEAQANTKTKEESSTKSDDGPRENIFKEWFGVGVGANYYQGGFEDKMTKREAALILGVRESSSAQRIKEAHRRLLVLNHPDTGGSTYVAGKINEAKELLLKGKS